MSFEIHMYSAVAKAVAVANRAPGQHGPMLIFVRQSQGSTHDLAAAAAVATREGWSEVDITKAGVLPADAGEAMDGAIRQAYEAAVQDGTGLMAYEVAVRPAPRK